MINFHSSGRGTMKSGNPVPNLDKGRVSEKLGKKNPTQNFAEGKGESRDKLGGFLV